MSPRQWQIWAFVCFGVGCLMALVMALGILVFHTPVWFLVAVYWVPIITMAFITSIRDYRGLRKRRERGELRARHS